MFCCWEIFKNIYFEEHLRAAASELSLESDCLELCIWTILHFDQLVIKTKKRPRIYFILFALTLGICLQSLLLILPLILSFFTKFLKNRYFCVPYF